MLKIFVLEGLYYVSGDALHLEAFHLYDLSGIACFIFIFKNKALFVFVKASISFQSVLIVFIQRNDYIPFESRAITLNDKQIIFVDAGIDHGIAFGTEYIKISFAKH